MVVYFHFFYCAEAFTHILQEVLVDVIVQVCEGNFFGQRLPHEILIILQRIGHRENKKNHLLFITSTSTCVFVLR